MSRSQERERRQIKDLRMKGIKVDDLSTCFQDGLNLCYLYEIISEEKLPRYSLKPQSMIQKTNNLAVVLKRINSFVEECGIRLQFSPQQIGSGDIRQVLGMLWILITKFVIPESEESLSRKRSLLRWVQRVSEPYDNVEVKNFTRSWKDGLAFNALLDQFDDTLMDYSSLTKDDPSKNLENAFAIAEKLGIYRLLDVEDFTEMDVPDEKSVMLYVSTMYQFFHSQAGRKLEQDAKQLVVDIGRLLDWVKKTIERFQIPENWTEKAVLDEQLEECRALEKDLLKFLEEREDFANFKAFLFMKLADIQRIQRNERLIVFTPPKEQDMGALLRSWEEMNDTIIAYLTALRDEIKKRTGSEEWRKEEEQRQEEIVKLEIYDSEATKFLTWISSTQSELTHVEKIGEDEEDESTDEETRNKRRQAAIDVKELIKPAVEAWKDVADTEIHSWASFPISELEYAKDTFLFALVGEESESLKEIRKFEFPESDTLKK